MLKLLSQLLQEASFFSPLLIERVIVGLLRLVMVTTTTDSDLEDGTLRTALHILGGLNAQIITANAEQISINIVKIITNRPGSLR